LAPKPSLDLSASAHDVELKNLTPYSLKYAGYPITKGRLDVDLHYKLENDQLTAENHLVIDQLTFGDHVENPTETHLPVRLAIALLKDSHGKIDVRIPVSGSLSNPQFSLGSLIWGAVRHLIERAVTAPFSLLANALGAGGGSGSGNAEQLQYIAFAPGSAALTDASREKLDTLAKLLAEKPNVKLDLSGRADENVDMPGLRMAYVDDLVKREKAKASGNDGQHVDLSSITLTTDEYHRYLTQVYKDADFKKPRNFAGLTKTLPDDDMKRALAFHAPVNEASLQALADQRAQNVRQYLSGKVDESRVAIVAPHFGTEGMKDNGPSTRVDLAPAAS
jgi:outer membrane protein OmpA-like peptidoglycan-associated protein